MKKFGMLVASIATLASSAYAYDYSRTLSDLYVVSNVR